jgi:amino acid transporter
LKSHVINIIGVVLCLVLGAVSALIAASNSQSVPEDSSQDWFYDLMTYGFGGAAFLFMIGFVVFAFRMSSNGKK